MAAFGVKKDEEKKQDESSDERIQRLQEEMLRTQVPIISPLNCVSLLYNFNVKLETFLSKPNAFHSLLNSFLNKLETLQEGGIFFQGKSSMTLFEFFL